MWWVSAIFLAVITYFYGLDGQYIPKNGDEYPYAHITRLTADSGHLLPLQSQLDNMRNTKPPLLFWQGIASTQEGKNWTLWNLRWPSVVYTLLTALLVFALAKKISREPRVGLFALLIWLAFFSTYRYGRPFLANPAEVFWLFLPFFMLLYWRPTSFESRWKFPLMMGVVIGVGLLYKSFALIAPVGLALSWWYLHHRRYRWREWLREDALKIALTVTVALAIFLLWFVFDPDPQSVWQEFVVGENAGKFDREGQYLKTLLWGGSSVWALLLGYPMNAGLLALPVIAIAVIAWRRRASLTDEEKLLWILLAAFFIVFSVPSQRSARYLLEAMPALAVLCALGWQRIHHGVFVVTLLLMGGVLALMAWLALHLQQEIPGDAYGGIFWLMLGGSGVVILFGLFMPRYAVSRTLLLALAVFLCYAMFVQPLDNGPGTYSANTQRAVAGKKVWVPCNFRAHEEGYRFLLPEAEVHGYHEEENLTAKELATRYRLFAFQSATQELECENCRVLGVRLVIRGRQNWDEIMEMLKGEVYQHLFAREWLIESDEMTVDRAAGVVENGCR
jgi:4-amino-4-deoxy-L-arabinose transferase-like glycosyltransferase